VYRGGDVELGYYFFASSKTETDGLILHKGVGRISLCFLSVCAPTTYDTPHTAPSTPSVLPHPPSSHTLHPPTPSILPHPPSSHTLHPPTPSILPHPPSSHTLHPPTPSTSHTAAPQRDATNERFSGGDAEEAELSSAPAQRSREHRSAACLLALGRGSHFQGTHHQSGPIRGSPQHRYHCSRRSCTHSRFVRRSWCFSAVLTAVLLLLLLLLLLGSPLSLFRMRLRLPVFLCVLFLLLWWRRLGWLVVCWCVSDPGSRYCHRFCCCSRCCLVSAARVIQDTLSSVLADARESSFFLCAPLSLLLSATALITHTHIHSLSLPLALAPSRSLSLSRPISARSLSLCSVCSTLYIHICAVILSHHLTVEPGTVDMFQVLCMVLPVNVVSGTDVDFDIDRVWASLTPADDVTRITIKAKFDATHIPPLSPIVSQSGEGESPVLRLAGHTPTLFALGVSAPTPTRSSSTSSSSHFLLRQQQQRSGDSPLAGSLLSPMQPEVLGDPRSSPPPTLRWEKTEASGDLLAAPPTDSSSLQSTPDPNRVRTRQVSRHRCDGV
jgi:hypothetical protein